MFMCICDNVAVFTVFNTKNHAFTTVYNTHCDTLGGKDDCLNCEA